VAGGLKKTRLPRAQATDTEDQSIGIDKSQMKHCGSVL
jgi:hypothetical protein